VLGPAEAGGLTEDDQRQLLRMVDGGEPQPPVARSTADRRTKLKDPDPQRLSADRLEPPTMVYWLPEAAGGIRLAPTTDASGDLSLIIELATMKRAWPAVLPTMSPAERQQCLMLWMESGRHHLLQGLTPGVWHSWKRFGEEQFNVELKQLSETLFPTTSNGSAHDAVHRFLDTPQPCIAVLQSRVGAEAEASAVSAQSRVGAEAEASAAMAQNRVGAEAEASATLSVEHVPPDRGVALGQMEQLLQQRPAALSSVWAAQISLKLTGMYSLTCCSCPVTYRVPLIAWVSWTVHAVITMLPFVTAD
jgi:hypothetical protein